MTADPEIIVLFVCFIKEKKLDQTGSNITVLLSSKGWSNTVDLQGEIQFWGGDESVHLCSQQVDRGEVQVFMVEVGTEAVLVPYLLLLTQRPQLILLNHTQQRLC